mgnify:CR=1 FL=1
MSNFKKTTQSFIISLFKYIKRDEPVKPIGRWGYSSGKLLDNKVRRSNEDHCGCCYTIKNHK